MLIGKLQANLPNLKSEGNCERWSVEMSHKSKSFFTEKQLALQWANRLNHNMTKISDLHARRKIMMFLVLQSQSGALTAPFDKPPVYANLDQVTGIVSTRAHESPAWFTLIWILFSQPDLTHENVYPEDFRLPIIMENSPDHGAFLVSQPIPKCGAFCYLAVVARPANK